MPKDVIIEMEPPKKKVEARVVRVTRWRQVDPSQLTNMGLFYALFFVSFGIITILLLALGLKHVTPL